MAIIACPDCDGTVSELAQSCPHCGRPMQNGWAAGSAYTFSGNMLTWSTGSVFSDSTSEYTDLNTGPGDNTPQGKSEHLRIHEGRYALSTQFGEHFRSVDFTDIAAYPMPGFRLLGTEVRTDILVHPGYPPTLYLSSIGCLNPTQPLTADQDMDFEESRARVIALIDSLREHDPAAFASNKLGDNTPIANAFIVITGEPMTPVGDEAVA